MNKLKKLKNKKNMKSTWLNINLM